MTAIIEPPTSTPTTAPPATRTEITALLDTGVRRAFQRYTARVQLARDVQHGMSMSALGGCTRQASYKIAGVPPSDVGEWPEARAANIGTMIHAGLLEFLADEIGGADELKVDLILEGLRIPGRTDLYSPALRLVGDLKTIGTYRFGSVGDTVNRTHRLQVMGYAKAIIDAGLPVDWIAWIYLDRSSGEHHVIVEPVTDELIAELRSRAADLALYGEEPESAPRDERGPGLSVVCDGCAWLRQCWGDDAEPGVIGAQKILAQDNESVAEALRLYDEARAKAKEAESDKEFARAMFSGYEPGKYGAWEFTWSAAGEARDKDAAVKALEEAGLPIPRKPGTKRLIVKRAKH